MMSRAKKMPITVRPTTGLVQVDTAGQLADDLGNGVFAPKFCFARWNFEDSRSTNRYS